MTGDADARMHVEVLHLLYAPANSTACLTHSISNILWPSNVRPPKSTWLRYMKAVYQHSKQKNTEVGLGFNRHWSELWLPFSVIFSALLIPLGLLAPCPMISRWQHPQIFMLPYSHPQLSDHGLTLDWWDTPGPIQGPGGGHALRPGSPDLPSTVPAVLGTWTGVDSTTQAAEWWGGTHTSLPVQGESGCLMLDFSHDTFGIHHFKKMRRKTTTGSFPSPNTPRKKNMLDTYLLGARPWTKFLKRNVKRQTPWPWGSLGVPPLLGPAPASASRSHEKTVKVEGAALAAVGRGYSASSVGPASRLWTDWFPRPWEAGTRRL